MPGLEDKIAELVTGFGEWFLDPRALGQGKMTNQLYPYSRLFEPIQVNALKIKNRIVMGPIGNINMADEMGRPSLKMIRYFQERAKGGVGLITTGLIPVSQSVDPSVTEPGDKSYFPRIDRSRSVFAGWRDLAEGVHAFGARFFIQLTPGLGRVGSPECLLTKHRLPVSASWNPSFYMPAVPCRPLTDGECRRIIVAAGQAAADAKAMEIDGVHLHGHEGYLLEQMANPAFNRRKLGRFSNWQAFGIELVQEIRRRVGDLYPIMYRIDFSLALNATYGERMSTVASLRKFRNERSGEMTLEYIANLVRAGVDLIDVDLGCYDNWWLPHPPYAMPPGCYLAISKIVKDYIGAQGIRSNQGLPVPVAAVGKLGYPDLAERALREGLCDMVMLARPLLSDPNWPNKVFAGKVHEIVPCIGNQEGCLNELVEGGHPQCSVNPRAAFEDVYAPEPVRAAKRKKVAVVGAGPAGVMCACTAASRGHVVTLIERQARAGGMLIPGSVPKFKFDLANYVDYLNNWVDRCSQEFKLIKRFHSQASADELAREGFDVIVTCTGGRPARLPVRGIDLPHVVQAVEFLCNPSIADRAQQVLVVGGGSVGCEVAYVLACERAKRVTIVEMLPHLMPGVCTATRGYLIHHLEQKRVEVLNCTRLKSVEETTATVVRNVSRTVPDPFVTWAPLLPENVRSPLARAIKVDETQVALGADLVILATGIVPDDSLYEACVTARAAPELYNIGDSAAAGRVFEAVKAGYALGRSL